MADGVVRTPLFTSRCRCVSRVVVVLQHKIYVYNFLDLKPIDRIDTCNNPKGAYRVVVVLLSSVVTSARVLLSGQVCAR